MQKELFLFIRDLVHNLISLNLFSYFLEYNIAGNLVPFSLGYIGVRIAVRSILGKSTNRGARGVGVGVGGGT